MEDCIICYTTVDTEINSWKVLPCKHKLCRSCFIKLDKTRCPMCRKNFNYTKEEIKQRINRGINYSNWQPPQQLTIPIEFTADNNIIFNLERLRNLDNHSIIINPPFSRLERNRRRKRRRNLSMDEIKERRRNIKKRCKRKWMMKNGRLNKMKWYEIPV